MTGNPEVIGSSSGLVPANALVLRNVRVVGKPEVIQDCLLQIELSLSSRERSF